MRTNRIYEIRLIVAGSRTFHDYKLAKEKLDRKCPDDVICKGRHSGTCRVLGREKPWD